MDLVRLCDFSKGWNDREERTRSEGLLVMENAVLTDRGGVATRPGTLLLGAANTSDPYVPSMHVSRTEDGTEVPIRASGTVLELYNPLTSSWGRLLSGLTARDWGFADHQTSDAIRGTDVKRYCYMGNGIDPMYRWLTTGYGLSTGALTGGELSIPVSTTLKPTVFHSDTASACSATTIDIASAKWFASQWNGGLGEFFYVLIKDGAKAGEVRKITATTTTQITFDTLTGLSGTPQFEIRQLRFLPSGTVVDGSTGTEEAYTAITREDALTSAGVVAAHADGIGWAQRPVALTQAPRGNILAVQYGQLYVSGSPRFPTAVWRSKIYDASDFAYSASRSAGEGDLIDFPTMVPKVSDVSVFEDSIIVGGGDAIETLSFTQDDADLPVRTPLVNSPLIGPAGRSARFGDDIIFANGNNEVTTLSRIDGKDTRPARTNMGWAAKRAFDGYAFDAARCWTFQQYTFVACKESADSDTNDLVLVFDGNRGVWVGKWSLPAACFATYGSRPYFGSSATRETYRLLHSETSQVKGTDAIGYRTRASTAWLNFTKDGHSLQQFRTLAAKGFVKPSTKVSFRAFLDRSAEPFTSWEYDPVSSAETVLGATAEEVLGTVPMGSSPLGTELSSENDEVGPYGELPFFALFRLTVPPHTWLRIEWETDGAGQYFELTDIMADIRPLPQQQEAYTIDVES